MNRRVAVATISALIAALYVVWRLAYVSWDPVAIFELGSQYARGEATGSEGYDGQFTYFIAVQPEPRAVAAKLDVPAYRYQRILLPLLGRLLGLGNPTWIPWALIALGLAGHWLGTWAVAGLLAGRATSEWFALSYGLWVGLVAPVGIGLAEPLAYGLAAIGLLAAVDGKRPLAGLAALALAGFAKETALIFLAAYLLAEITGRRRRRVLVGGAVALGAHGLWQLWLLSQFGALGIGSGGDMATPFEWIPFMGLFRIGTVSPPALLLYLLIFGPAVVLPATWGVIRAGRDWFQGGRSVELYALFGHGLATMLLPFSTFREPLGIVRAVDGLVLAVLVYAARDRARRPLRYSLLWVAWLALLISR